MVIIVTQLQHQKVGHKLYSKWLYSYRILKDLEANNLIDWSKANLPYLVSYLCNSILLFTITYGTVHRGDLRGKKPALDFSMLVLFLFC